MVALKEQIAEQVMPVKKKSAFFLVCIICMISFGCADEWGDAEVGRVSCTFNELNDFLPNASRPLKFASGNNGNNLYILDDFYHVYSYKKDNLYTCAFNLENTYPFNAFPSDVLFANGNFYVQDGARLVSASETERCEAKSGVFATYGNELAVGSNMGIEIWSIKPCQKKGEVFSQKVLALTATNDEYYAAEGIDAEPKNLAMIPKNGSIVYREPLSSIPGNEKNFCSADRITANNYGVYLLDKKCKKIGVFDNQAVWRKSISLDSLKIRNPLDIAVDEYSYIFILHERGVERINVF